MGSINGAAGVGVVTDWLQLWIFRGAALLLTVSVFGCAFEGLVRRLRTASGIRLLERACVDFADAVALGDLDGAETIAALVFAGREARGSRRGRCGRRQVIEWDERKRFALPLEKVRLQFIEPAATGFWFPEMERAPEGGRIDVLLGPGESNRVRLSESWTPELDGCSFTGEAASFRVSGRLELRTVNVGAGAREPDDTTTATEARVHVEAPDSDRTRQALARARTIVRDGLGRMAAELDRTGPR
jgi:hypothetical protein